MNPTYAPSAKGKGFIAKDVKDKEIKNPANSEKFRERTQKAKKSSLFMTSKELYESKN